MKKLIVFILALLGMVAVQAKKVKFSVNMKGQTISQNGIHVAGDFQTLAGFPGGDWNSATISLSREIADTNIYSVVLELPAHRKYEYKYVNGDLFYEVEFVPDESRVGYDFNDNRWFYLDSLNADTTQLGPMLFAGNAPEGMRLLRLRVDMKKVGTIHSSGVFVGANFNSYNYVLAKMYSFTGTAYEYYTFLKEGDSAYYHFSNGNSASGKETVPSSCALNQNRYAVLNSDVVLDSVCFASCSLCATASGVNELGTQVGGFSIFPNPANAYVVISSEQSMPIDGIQLVDMQGALLAEPSIQKGSRSMLVDLPLPSGIYFLRIKSGDLTLVHKIVLTH